MVSILLITIPKDYDFKGTKLADLKAGGVAWHFSKRSPKLDSGIVGIVHDGELMGFSKFSKDPKDFGWLSMGAAFYYSGWVDSSRIHVGTTPMTGFQGYRYMSWISNLYDVVMKYIEEGKYYDT